MKQQVDYWWITWSLVFIFIFHGVALWHLWLALPFVAGYNLSTSVYYAAIGLFMHWCGCLSENDWRYRQDYYVHTYHGENWNE